MRAVVQVLKGEELIFEKVTSSSIEVAEIHRLYANHGTCVVKVSYLPEPSATPALPW